jgi:hypothetical protein
MPPFHLGRGGLADGFRACFVLRFREELRHSRCLASVQWASAQHGRAAGCRAHRLDGWARSRVVRRSRRVCGAAAGDRRLISHHRHGRVLPDRQPTGCCIAAVPTPRPHLQVINPAGLAWPLPLNPPVDAVAHHRLGRRHRGAPTGPSRTTARTHRSISLSTGCLEVEHACCQDTGS